MLEREPSHYGSVGSLSGRDRVPLEEVVYRTSGYFNLIQSSLSFGVTPALGKARVGRPCRPLAACLDQSAHAGVMIYRTLSRFTFPQTHPFTPSSHQSLLPRKTKWGRRGTLL